MSYRISFSIIFIFIIPLVASSQSSLEVLRNISIPKYIMVYSERFTKDGKSGYYFIIDEGQKDIKNTLDSVRDNMVITDSSFYLKDKKGLTVSFESSLGFINYMIIHGWELICNNYTGNAVFIRDTPAKELYGFLLRKRIR
jgi:hypothetical protein